MQQRYVQFNVEELIEEAERCAGSAKCIRFRKIAEGTSNKLFELTLDNGKSLIARIPFATAGPAHFTTASEVATMEFAREILHLPVPKVVSWCSRATPGTGVGVEYIIMEKCEGVQLLDRWANIPRSTLVTLLNQIVLFEKAMTEHVFDTLGSIYFAHDLPADVPYVLLELSQDQSQRRYVVGPSVDRRFWRGKRGSMKLDRGPWNSLLAYVDAIAACEIAWLESHAQPHNPNSPLFRSKHENDPQVHIRLLKAYQKVMPYLVPPPEFLRFTLRHPDFHASNILMDASGAGEAGITAVIDWQTARVEPLLQSMDIPNFLDFQGGKYVEKPPPAFQRPNPKLPDSFLTLDEEAQKQAKFEFREASRYKFYTMLTEEQNPVLHSYRSFNEARLCLWPMYWASRTWDEGLAVFTRSLINVCDNWHLIADDPCPIQFTEQERCTNAAALKEYLSEVGASFLVEEFGAQQDGWVKTENLAKAKRLNAGALSRALVGKSEEEQAQIRRTWPFQDGALSLTGEPCR